MRVFWSTVRHIYNKNCDHACTFSLAQFTVLNAFQDIAKQEQCLFCYTFYFLVPYSVYMPLSRDDDHETRRVRRDNPNGAILYSESFMVATGPYSSSGKYVASGQIFNGYPVYTGPNGSTYWKIYVKKVGEGYKWVLNGNVHNEWHGTVAYMDRLFSPLI